MAKKSMRVIGEYTMITAATFVVAAAVYFFLIPSGVSVGSISGLAMLLGNVIPLPISVLTFILNAALLVVGFLFIGREFGVKTVYTSLILPVFLWVFEQVFPGRSRLPKAAPSRDHRSGRSLPEPRGRW